MRVLVESLVPAYAATLAAAVAAGVLGLFLGKMADYLFVGPSFFLPAFAGAALAYVFRKRLTRSSYFAWIIPAALFLRGYLELARAPYPQPPEIWQDLVGTGCDSSECLYEVFFTAPLISSLAYSITAAFLLSRRKPHGAEDNETYGNQQISGRG